ncbi:condensation domain-containing protein [Chitinophaga pinensis]|uniref:AMP-dependent synthetase and ligase n=1 Tax=Chitinophaga pinensis (strain ATCC 43595 / DSM 2588 / LMG 13176 / NBRC 15968 / NCIMB 11800 / UQM 2034) TaxID=485918 RepID=A0A979GRE4_CHIPD|nr:condensation domain-containing protein [Chitinophaga pinensis]ACU60873.1 AMP-dependent synthetase and ligase [Chitinophaga pinensis DSM 2588]
MKYPLLHELFDNISSKYPSRTAVANGQQEVSYEALQQRSLQLAASLQDAGLEKETVVATLLPAGADLAATTIALFRTGLIYMPLDPRIPIIRVQNMLSITGSKVIVTNKELLDTARNIVKGGPDSLQYVLVLDDVATQLFSVDKAGTLAPAAFPGNVAQNDTETDSCYIFFTSGTTGSGKPILGSHQGLSQYIHWEIKEFGLNENCRVSQLAQVTFDASLRDLFVPLCTGGTLCVLPADAKFQMPVLIEWLKAQKVSLIHCVPSIFRLLTRELEQQPVGSVAFPDLKFILMAGEMLYAKDIAAWRRVAGTTTELVNLYGASETTLVKTFHRISEIPEDGGEALHVGQPIDQAFIAVMNGNRLARIGEIGEIYIITHYTSKGYFADPVKTAERFVKNPLEGSSVPLAYRTGDMGRYRKDRSIEVLGRQDDQLKINGIRVELQELEQIILETAGIAQVVIKAIESPTGAMELACYYTGVAQDATKLRSVLKEKLSDSVLPAYFIHLKEFPLTLNGKVDKAALIKPEYKDNTDAAGGSAVVASASETIMEDIWRDVFKMKQIGRNASFFSIGGTSLKAIRVISQVYKRFEVMITINDLFANPTIATLTGFVEKGSKKAFTAIRPVAKQDTYEVSAVQKRIWAIDQFSDNGALYNVPEFYLFEGPLDTAAFEKALAALVGRHEILRTTFELINGEPRQRIHDAASWNVSLKLYDYSNEASPLDKAIAFSTEAALEPFDLQNGPLLRTTLLKTGKDEHLFVFVTHHIVSDAWSQEIIARDVLAFYDAFNEGKQTALEPLKIQYKDFAAWHNERLTSRSADHRAFWKAQFAEAAPKLKLPLDYPRPAQQTFNAEEVSFRLNEKVSTALRSLAVQHKVSGFNAVMALVKLLLYKHTAQQDIVIGSPVADRAHADTDNQIGVYFNTLPLRTRFSGTDNFTQLLGKVAEVTLRAFDHVDYPFENVLEDIDAEFDKQRNSLFDVGLTYISFMNAASDAGTADQQAEDATITVKGIYPGFKYIKSDLWIKAVENGNEPFVFVLAYNTDLFKASFATKLMDDLNGLAALVVEQPSASLDTLIANVKTQSAEADEQKQQHVRHRNLEVLKNFRVGAR